jgi:hypothetical protein
MSSVPALAADPEAPADVIPVREHTYLSRLHIPGTLSQAAARIAK